MILVELIIEEFPVGFTLDPLTSLSQNYWLLLLWLNTRKQLLLQHCMKLKFNGQRTKLSQRLPVLFLVLFYRLSVPANVTTSLQRVSRSPSTARSSFSCSRAPVSHKTIQTRSNKGCKFWEKSSSYRDWTKVWLEFIQKGFDIFKQKCTCASFRLSLM